MIRDARNEAVANADGDHAEDDFKPAAQAVHRTTKRELRLLQAGETKEAFMRDVLAPLVTKETEVYQTLKKHIFNQ